MPHTLICDLQHYLFIYFFQSAISAYFGWVQHVLVRYMVSDLDYSKGLKHFSPGAFGVGLIFYILILDDLLCYLVMVGSNCMNT